MNDTEVLARFSDAVQCRTDRGGPLGLTLIGYEGAVPVQVSFVCAPPADWPERLEGAVVVREAPTHFRITEAHDARMLEASGVFVHRDVGRIVESVVPSRPAPLTKRLFWRVVLALAATSPGRRALRALRG
jgi:hypothetical protein